MTAFLDAVNAAIGHMNDMQLQPALDALEPICGGDLAGESETERMALAAALYLKGLVLDRQGRSAEAFSAHAQCIERHALVLEPLVQQYVMQCQDGDVLLHGLDGHAELLAELPPAHHAFRLPTNVNQARAIETELAHEPELRQQYRDSLWKIILNDDARASEQHRAARAVLAGHFEAHQPFGLYLRNFDIEASEQRLADGSLLTFTTSDVGYVEARAERDLAGGLPLVGLANGTNFRRDFAHAIPKLEVANVLWQTVLRLLATRARVVLFDYRHAAPGVVVELDLLVSLGRADDTVLIVADEPARADVRRRWPAFPHVRLPDESST